MPQDQYKNQAHSYSNEGEQLAPHVPFQFDDEVFNLAQGIDSNNIKSAKLIGWGNYGYVLELETINGIPGFCGPGGSVALKITKEPIYIRKDIENAIHIADSGIKIENSLPGTVAKLDQDIPIYIPESDKGNLPPDIPVNIPANTICLMLPYVSPDKKEAANLDVKNATNLDKKNATNLESFLKRFYQQNGFNLNKLDLKATEIGKRERLLCTSPGVMLARFVSDIKEGQAELHQAGIIHSDSAARNCLVGENKLKVGDLGISVQVNADGIAIRDPNMQVPLYMFDQRNYLKQEVTVATDIFSLKCLMLANCIYLMGGDEASVLRTSDIPGKNKEGKPYETEMRESLGTNEAVLSRYFERTETYYHTVVKLQALNASMSEKYKELIFSEIDKRLESIYEDRSKVDTDKFLDTLEEDLLEQFEDDEEGISEAIDALRHSSINIEDMRRLQIKANETIKISESQLQEIKLYMDSYRDYIKYVPDETNIAKAESADLEMQMKHNEKFIINTMQLKAQKCTANDDMAQADFEITKLGLLDLTVSEEFAKSRFYKELLDENARSDYFINPNKADFVALPEIQNAQNDIAQSTIVSRDEIKNDLQQFDKELEGEIKLYETELDEEHIKLVKLQQNPQLEGIEKMLEAEARIIEALTLAKEKAERAKIVADKSLDELKDKPQDSEKIQKNISRMKEKFTAGKNLLLKIKQTLNRTQSKRMNIDLPELENQDNMRKKLENIRLEVSNNMKKYENNASAKSLYVNLEKKINAYDETNKSLFNAENVSESDLAKAYSALTSFEADLKKINRLADKFEKLTSKQQSLTDLPESPEPIKTEERRNLKQDYANLEKRLTSLLTQDKHNATLPNHKLKALLEDIQNDMKQIPDDSASLSKESYDHYKNRLGDFIKMKNEPTAPPLNKTQLGITPKQEEERPKEIETKFVMK